jgi:nitrogen fixation/metabolism regulation signal transduction histidine kinase
MTPTELDQGQRSENDAKQVSGGTHASESLAALPLTGKRKASRVSVSHDLHVFLLALGGGFPGVLVSMILIWGGSYTPKVQWTLTLFVVGAWLGFCFSVRERVVKPLQTLSNLLAALREGDYSIRARGASTNEPLGQVMLEANVLGETLHDQRLGAVEATNLLRTVMAEIDVAVFTFNDQKELKLVNRAGERLVAQPADALLGRKASELGLSECLEGEQERTFQKTFPGRSGRWGMRRGRFREEGRRHHVVVLSDLSQALREEERQAWRRLIRVIGHELNNSLAPIKSMAGTLAHLLDRSSSLPDWRDDMKRGLSVIGERSESLSRFMSAYARLARLPQPTFQVVDVASLVHRIVALQTSYPVTVVPGATISIQADGDQLEQLLINLLRNAVEATAETKGSVTVGWSVDGTGSTLEVFIDDEGPGLPNTTNLFVPFFTTKVGGSGIGLVLSRQIAEAHGGTLDLVDRPGARGCRALLRLPVRDNTNTNGLDVDVDVEGEGEGEGDVESTAAGSDTDTPTPTDSVRATASQKP